MITQLKAYPLLKGYRNTPPADIDALVWHIMQHFTVSYGEPRNQRAGPQPSDGIPERRKNSRRKNNLGIDFHFFPANIEFVLLI